jgi:hypothetical protein
MGTAIDQPVDPPQGVESSDYGQYGASYRFAR